MIQQSHDKIRFRDFKENRKIISTTQSVKPQKNNHQHDHGNYSSQLRLPVLLMQGKYFNH